MQVSSAANDSIGALMTSGQLDPSRHVARGRARRQDRRMRCRPATSQAVLGVQRAIP
mgnify:CR=1 FL=1